MIGGYSANWGAIGAMAAAAQSGSTPDPKDLKIKELVDQVRVLTDKLSMTESKLSHRDDGLSKANAVVDDQAAQIVDLQGKLALARPTSLHDATHAKRLMKIEDDLRRSLERAEARASQLVGYMQEHKIDVPNEPPYFRGGGTFPSF